MPLFNRLPGESYLDYLWRNFGGKTVKGDSNVLLTDDQIDTSIESHIDIRQEALKGEIYEKVGQDIITQIQEKVVGKDTDSIAVTVEDGGTVSADLKIDENPTSPIKLAVSENGVRADLEIDDKSSVTLDTSSGKLKADIILEGSGKTLKFQKLSSEEYFSLSGRIELGKLYILSDAPDMYLDGLRYGTDPRLTDGLVQSIRYEPGFLYYTVSGNTTEKKVAIDEVSETNPGLMTSEELIALNNIIKALEGVDNVADLIDAKILKVSLSKEGNDLKLTYKLGEDDVELGTVEIEPDKYLKEVVRRPATIEDVYLAGEQGVVVKEGDQVLVLSVLNGDTFYINVGGLVLDAMTSSLEDSNTIEFEQKNGYTVANVKIDEEAKSNYLKATNNGLVATVNLSTYDDNLLSFDELGDLLVQFNWNSNPEEGSVKIGKGRTENYNEEDENLIYFDTQLRALYVNGENYALTAELEVLLNNLKDAVIDVSCSEKDPYIYIKRASDPDTEIPLALPIVSPKTEFDEGNAGLMTAEQAAKLDSIHKVDAGNGLIAVGDDDKVISVSLTNDEKLLYFTNNGDLATSISLTYDDDGIKLLGINDTVLGTVSLGELKDGVVKDIEVVDFNEETQESGIFLKLTWTKEAFNTEGNFIKYIDLSQLLITYVASNGIDITYDLEQKVNKVSLKLATDNATREFITFDENGYLIADGIVQLKNDLYTIINGKDAEGNIGDTYRADDIDGKSIASDIKELQDWVDEMQGILDDGFVLDVKVNGVSVVDEDNVANIEMTAENTIYEENLDETVSVKDKILLMDGSITEEGSIRYDSAQYTDQSLDWLELSD